MMSYYPVELKIPGVESNRSRDGRDTWMVTSLFERAKGLPVFDLPLCAVDLSRKVYEPIERPIDLAKQVKRTMDADLSYPVILDSDGFIMDGWHRVMKALVLGIPTIKAVRFVVTPPPDYVRDEED